MNQSNLRKVIKAWLDTVVGDPHIFTLDFDSDFVSGNQITGSINSEDIFQVDYTTSHDNTLKLLAFSLQNSDAIQTAKITGVRQITVTAHMTNTALTANLNISGGSAQPVFTQTTTQAPSSVSVNFLNQKMEESAEHCLFNILSVKPVGIDGYQKINFETNLSLLVGNRIATVNIVYIGNYALEKSSRIYNALYTDSTTSYFQSHKMAIVRREPIKDLTNLLDTDFQQRADFDFYLRFNEETEEDRGSIEHIVIDGNVSDDVDIETLDPIKIDFS